MSYDSDCSERNREELSMLPRKRPFLIRKPRLSREVGQDTGDDFGYEPPTDP